MKLDLSATPIPPELQWLVQNLIEGNVKSLAFVAEADNNRMITGLHTNIDGSNSNSFAVIGGIEALKRDALRCLIESRVPYVEVSNDEDQE